MLYKLRDIFDLQMGKTPSRDNNMYWKDGNLPWVSISDLSKSQIYIENSKELITKFAVKDTLVKCIPKDTVIMSFKLSLGKTAITRKPLYTNEAIMAFIDKKVIQIEPKYIYFLFSYIQWGQFTNNAVKGKTLNKKFFSDFQINIPKYTQQTKVSSILIRINKILEYKRSLIEIYDALIKSRFVEMFGDLNHNPLYPVVNLKSLIMGSPSNGFFASKELYDKNGKVNLVGVKEVVGNLYINIYDTPKLNVDESILEKYLIDYGDMLFCRSSLVKSGIAKASIVPKSNNKSCIFECHTIKIKFNQQLCIPEFMQVQTEQTYFRNQVIQNSKTATMTTISKQGIVDTKVLLPPLSIQQKFTKFLSQINKLKSDVQKSIDETQLLMDSLMQEYFG